MPSLNMVVSISLDTILVALLKVSVKDSYFFTPSHFFNLICCLSYQILNSTGLCEDSALSLMVKSVILWVKCSEAMQ